MIVYGDDYVVGLDNGVQYIRDIVNDQFSKDEMIEAIKYCNMDAAAALYHLFEKGTYVRVNSIIATYRNYTEYLRI